MDSQETKKKICSLRTSTLQYEELVKYMETHSEFAANKFLTKEGRTHHNHQWDELKDMLNALSNGPGKTTKQWQIVNIHTQTVWRDLKSITSKKASKLRNEKNRTGNFPINAEPLDKLEQRVIGCMGLEYVQGASNCPDSTPEEEEYQIQLERGNENVLRIPPVITSVQDLIRVENTGGININNDDDDEIIARLLEKQVDDPLSYQEVVQSYDDQGEIVIAGRAKDGQLAKQKPNRNETKSGQSSQNRKNKQRIGVQLQEAREKFSHIAGNHAEALQLFSEASMKQAEAALLRAKTEERRLQFEERHLALEEHKIRTDEKLITVLNNLQETLNKILM